MPVRLLDRISSALVGLGAHMQAAAGRSGLAMNVTATQSGAAGYVTVWPDGTQPTASGLNVTAANQTIANHVIMATGSDGGVRLFTQPAAHLVVDVTGWYV